MKVLPRLNLTRYFRNALCIFLTYALLLFSIPNQANAQSANIANLNISDIANQIAEIAVQYKTFNFDISTYDGESLASIKKISTFVDLNTVVERKLVDVLNKGYYEDDVYAADENGIFLIGSGYGVKETKQFNTPSNEKDIPCGKEIRSGVYEWPDDAKEGLYITRTFGAKPSLTIKDGSYVLVQGVDYDLSYANNYKIGQATIDITGKGNYAGLKTSKTFEIIGYRVARYYPSSNQYKWGTTMTYPSTDINNTQGGDTVIVKNIAGKFVQINCKTGEVYEDENNITTYSSNCVKLDATPNTNKLQINSEKNINGEFLWSDYSTYVDTDDQLFNTPVDVGKLYMDSETCDKFGILRWELQNGHFAWTKVVPQQSNKNIDTYSLANFISTELKNLANAYYSESAIYAGQDKLRTYFNDNQQLAENALADKYLSTSFYPAAGIAMSALAGATNKTQEDLYKLIKTEFVKNTTNEQTVLPSLYTYEVGKPYIKSGYDIYLQDNGILELLKTEGYNSNVMATRSIVNGALVDLKIDSSQLAGPTNVEKQTLTIYPYVLTNGDLTNTVIFGNKTSYSNAVINTGNFKKAKNNLVQNPSANTDFTHGGEVLVNNGSALFVEGNSLNLQLKLKTAYQDNVLSDIYAKEGTDWQTADYKVTVKKYNEDGSLSDTVVDRNAITDKGKYQITWEGLYPASKFTSSNNANKAFTNGTTRYPVFAGSVSADFEVKEATSADLTAAISSANTAKKDGIAVVSPDGFASLTGGAKYHSKESADALDVALSAAKALDGKEGVTSAQMGAAINTLNAAIAGYAALTYSVDDSAFTALQNAYTGANNKLTSVKPSADSGKTTTAGVQLAAGELWAEAGAYTALQTKAAEVKALLDKGEAACGKTAAELQTLASELKRQTDVLATTAAIGPAAKKSVAGATVTLKADVPAGATVPTFTLESGKSLALADVLNTVVLEGKTLSSATDFDAVLKDDKGATCTAITGAGNYLLVITGKGEAYAGEKQVAFEVKAPPAPPKTDISGANIVLKAGSGKGGAFEFDGAKAITLNDVFSSADLGGKSLAKDTDFTVVIEGKTNGSPNGKVVSSINAVGDYYVTVTGIGEYAGTARKSFSVAKMAPPAVKEELVLSSYTDASGNMFIKGMKGGKAVKLAAWQTSPQNISVVTDVNSDGVLEVAYQDVGKVTVNAQTADGESAFVRFLSPGAPVKVGDPAPATAAVKDTTSGVSIGGLLKKLVDGSAGVNVTASVKTGDEVKLVSSVNTAVAGNKQLAKFEISLLADGAAVQPTGEIELAFPVSAALKDAGGVVGSGGAVSVPAGMELVAYHWKDGATAPERLVASGYDATTGEAKFTVDSLSPFEIALEKKVTSGTGSSGGSAGSGDGSGDGSGGGAGGNGSGSGVKPNGTLLGDTPNGGSGGSGSGGGVNGNLAKSGERPATVLAVSLLMLMLSVGVIGFTGGHRIALSTTPKRKQPRHAKH